MNIENIRNVINALQANPEGFNMNDDSTCIAGFCRSLSPYEHPQTYLGLSNSAWANLYMPNKHVIESYDDVPVTEAIATLERLIKTGEVHWENI